MRPLPGLIFASRWLQLPLYLGLIIAQGVTSGCSGRTLLRAARRLGNADALAHVLEAVSVEGREAPR